MERNYPNGPLKDSESFFSDRRVRIGKLPAGYRFDPYTFQGIQLFMCRLNQIESNADESPQNRGKARSLIMEFVPHLPLWHPQALNVASYI